MRLEAEEALAARCSMAEVLRDSEKCYDGIKLDLAARRMSHAGFPGRLVATGVQGSRGMSAAGSSKLWRRRQSKSNLKFFEKRKHRNYQNMEETCVCEKTFSQNVSGCVWSRS